MALTQTAPNQANSVANFYSSQMVSDAVAAADTYVNMGFKPRYVKIFNLTDLSTQEWFDAAGAGVLNEVTAGTKSNVAAGVIAPDAGGITLKAAIIPASKTFYIIAFG